MMVYVRKRHSSEHRAKLSAAHRKWWGAPEGMATVRGIHVPFEYRDAIAYFANRIAVRQSPEIAAQYVQKIKDDGFRAIPMLKEYHQMGIDVQANRRLILQATNEVNRANQNRR